MSHKSLKHIKRTTKKLFRGLSMRRDEYFFHNLVVGLSVVMIWVGIWGILEIYLIDYGIVGRIACVVVGIVLLYLVDGGIDQLGGRGGSDEE